jgi:transposase
MRFRGPQALPDKQGSSFLRMLLVEAAQAAVCHDPEFRKEYLHRCHTKAKGMAKVAVARKLAIRLYWMLRTMVGIQRSFVSRAARGWPWSAQARP